MLVYQRVMAVWTPKDLVEIPYRSKTSQTLLGKRRHSLAPHAAAKGGRPAKGCLEDHRDDE